MDIYYFNPQKLTESKVGRYQNQQRMNLAIQNKQQMIPN